jgi:hypothetical protein
VRQQLKALLEAAATQQVESFTSRQRSECGRARAPSAHGLNPPPSQHQGRGEGVGAVTSAVKICLGPNRDARNTIEARRQAESVDNNRENCSRHHDDRGCRRCHDNDDDAGVVFPSEDGAVHMILGDHRRDPQDGARSSSCEKSSTPTLRGRPT